MSLSKIFRFAVWCFALLSLCALSTVAQGNYWQTVPGPFGDCITSFVKTSSGKILAATRDSAVYRSADNGLTWTKASTGITKRTIFNLIESTDGSLIAASGGLGLFRSTSDGSLWAAHGNIFDNIVLTGLAINSNGFIFVSSYKGVFRSSSSGTFFMEQKNGLSTNLFLCVTTNPTGHVFLGSESAGIFKTTNNGTLWSKVGTGVPNIPILSLASNQNGNIFAGTDGDGIYRSTDNGSNFTKLSLDAASTFVNSISINMNGDILAATNHGLWKSKTNGDSWQLIHASLSELSLFTVKYLTDTQIIAGTFDSKVYVSNDNGSNWTSTSIAPRAQPIHSFFINSADHLFAGSNGGGIALSTNNGNTWTQFNMPQLIHTFYDLKCILRLSNNHLIVGTEGYGILKSTDNGKNWFDANTGLTYKYNYSFAVTPGGTIFSGTGGGGVFKSTNNGDSWQAVNNGLTSTNSYAFTFNALGHLFVGTLGGGLFKTTDEGASWTSGGSGISNRFINAMHTLPNGKMYAATAGEGIYVSSDNGNIWVKISTNTGVNNASVLTSNSLGHLFAGTMGSGVLLSKDGGSAWTSVTSGMFDKNVNALAINSNGIIFAGTESGINRSSASTTITAPAIATSVSQLQFGTIQVNATSTKQLDISNTGDADLIVSGVSINPNGDFSTTFSTPVTITPGNKVVLKVDFKPTTLGTKTGTLQIQSNDAQNPTINIPLNGTASAQPKPRIVISVTSIDFGTVVIPNTRKAYLVMQNTGNAMLTIASAQISGADASDFVVKTTLPRNIIASGRDSIEITFQPTTRGQKSAQVQIAHNDTDQGNVIIQLSGGAMAPGALSISPLTINFGTMKANDAARQRGIVIQNTGDVSVTITKQQLTGANASEFTVIKNLASAIAAKGIDSIVISFTPSSSALGMKSATCTIESDATGAQKTDIALTAEVQPTVGVETLAETSFRVFQAFPNPVSKSSGTDASSVTFSFELMRRSYVTLSIFSVTGKQVATLLSGTFDAGLYARDFSPAALEPGLYFSRITCDGKSEMKKFVVIE